MSLRLALHELSDRHGLAPPERRRLEQLAGLHDEPAQVDPWSRRAAAVLAAALGGLGIVFWIAANWESLGRFGRFALLQGLVLAMCAGALWRPLARAPLALVALLGIGALFAYFGQTYQTGADPWQLFALWAALSLPLALATRSDVVWAPWTLVAMTGVSLWVHAHAGHRWEVGPQDLPVHLVGWVAGLLVVAMTSALAQRWTGAGVWALRTALTCWVIVVTSTSLMALFHTPVAPHYLLGLLLLAGAAAALASPRLFDVYGLSAMGLGIDTLLVSGLARMLLEGHHGDPIGELLLIGLAAAGLLAATVSAVLRLARRHATTEELA